MDLETHNEFEQIRQLKSRYFRLMDTQQWETWRDCFTDDISATYEGAPRKSPQAPTTIGCEGKQALIDGVSALMTGAKSMHQGFMPELELTSATTAKGIWAMYDYVRLPECAFQGWGHYHEDYVKEDGQWKLKKIYLTRLHTEEVWS
ncbi:MAG: nuclear transport factor 2 family protein [Pseudomonadota bacterium]